MRKFVKRLVLAAAACSAMMAVSAFASDDVVDIAYTALPDALIQTKHTPEVPAGIVYAQTLDTLIAKNADGEFEPRLAESWEVNDDATEYTFKLREDVKWSDGEQLDADDVVYTFTMLQEAPGFSVIAGDISAVEKLGDYEVKITLSKPNVVFLADVAVGMYGAIQPAHGEEKFEGNYGTSADTTLCCGPYIITEWVPDVSITMEANPDYYRGEPDIKKIVFHEMLDVNSTVVALQTGEIDVSFSSISGTAYTTLSAEPDVVIEEFASARNEGVYMYCPDGIFSDVRMRQAVAYGINPEEALLVAADGLGTLIRYPGDIGSIMTGNPVDYESEYQYSYDLEKAKALVAECGNEGAAVAIKSYNTEPYATFGTWLQSVLTNIGLNATVEPMERAAFLDEMQKGLVTILPLAWVGQAYDLDEVLAGPVYSINGGSSNYSFYSDEEMDALVEASRAEADPAAREEIFKQIIDKFLQDVPFVPLYAVTSAFPHASSITCDNPKSYSMFDYHWAE